MRFTSVADNVVMPGLSGRELAGRLVDHHPALKVLYMSGYTDNAIVHHGVLDGGTLLIRKPFSKVAGSRKIHEALQS